MNAFWAFKTSVFMKGVSLKDNLFCRNLGNGVYTLRERNKVPTASNCADGNLSGPSAQHEDGAGKLDHRRHMIAVGIGRAVLTAAVGTTYADG
jgi:hypothetical protein